MNFSDLRKPLSVSLHFWISLSICTLLASLFTSCAQPISPTLDLTPTSGTLVAGQATQLTVTRRFTGGSPDDVTSKVTYTSTNRNIASVNDRGIVTAGIEPGSVIIKAFDSISDATALASFNVIAPQITSIDINPSPAIVMTRGTMRPFTATARFNNGTTADVTKSVEWTSTNTAAALVGDTQADKGFVSAVSGGDTTILATDLVTLVQGRSIVFVSQETPNLIAVVVTPNPAQVNVGATVQFGALGILSDGTTKDLTRSATWSSSRNDVATVDNTGLVKGVAVGDATITAAAPEPSTSIRGSAPAKVVP